MGSVVMKTGPSLSSSVIPVAWEPFTTAPEVTDDDSEGPVFMTTEPHLLQSETIGAQDVFGLILDHVYSD